MKVFQQALEVNPITYVELAYRLGWLKKNSRNKPSADVSRVQRTLGFIKDRNGYRTTLTEDMALKMAKAMHLDPIDIGL